METSEEVKEMENYLEALDMEVLEEIKKVERNIIQLNGQVKKVKRSMEKVDGALKDSKRNVETDGIEKEFERYMETVDGRVNELDRILKQFKEMYKEIIPNQNKETVADEIKNAPWLIDLNAFKKWKENEFNFSRVLCKQATLLNSAYQRGRELQVLIENEANVEVNSGDESEVLINFCKL